MCRALEEILRVIACVLAALVIANIAVGVILGQYWWWSL